LACPYFVPREILNDGSWPHPSRLPLGAGWSGECCAGAQPTTPGTAVLRDSCNLGNAAACPHLPADRDWDAVRFSIASTSLDQITLWYVCERGHAPIEHGKLTFNLAGGICRNPHPDPRVQRLANSYFEAWWMRQIPAAMEASASAAL